MENKLRIGSDIDDVIVHTCIELTSISREIFNTTFTNEDVTMYSFKPHLNNEELSILLKIFNGYHLDILKPNAKAINVINKLSSDGNEIVLITARECPTNGYNIDKDTVKWLKQNNVSYNNLIFARSNTKPNLVKNYLRVDMMIEDNLCTAIGCALLNIPTVLVNQPWNKAEEKDYIIQSKVYTKDQIQRAGAMIYRIDPNDWNEVSDIAYHISKNK